MSWMWLLSVAVLAGLYAPVFQQLGGVWWTDTYAAHGLFVPLFSAVLAWLDRDRLRATAGRGHPAGAVLVLGALGVLGVGWWRGSLFLQGLSAVVAVAGLVLWGLGALCLRRAAFPVAFLLLMLPLPRAAVDAVTLDLQLFAVEFAGLALALADVPFYRHGLLIQLPSITLEVAEICNGLRFLLALFVLTVAFAQVTQRTVPRKLLLVASAIPIAILANAFRVAVIAAGVHYVGPEVAGGIIHHSIGKAVWALTLVPLLVLGVLLRLSERPVARCERPAHAAGEVEIPR